jgi:hypothetical protein
MKIDYEFIDCTTIRITMTNGTDTYARNIDLTQKGELVIIPASRYAKDKAVIEAAFKMVKLLGYVARPDTEPVRKAVEAHPNYKEEE